MAPVAAGTGAAAGASAASVPRALLALVVALALQVGVNYANDYSDGVRGTDANRVGPFRLTGSGAAHPAAVRHAAFAAFAVAALAGVGLVALSGSWWLLAVGAAAIASAWYYTGGRAPYGYRGLGEIFTFVFFGLVAVLGTTYTQAGRVPFAAVAAAVALGCLACALLLANNLRDVPTDALAGKRTLAVRLGEPRTRQLYAGLVVIPFLLAVVIAAATLTARRSAFPLIALLAAPLAATPTRTVVRAATGPALVPVLRDTGRLALAFGVLLGVGIALAGPL